MSYTVGLYQLPAHLETIAVEDESVLFAIVYLSNDDSNLLAYTNFSVGNPSKDLFEEIFDIEITGCDYYKIYKYEDYNKAKDKLKEMNINNDTLLERIQQFLSSMEIELNKNQIIFFCCS